MWTLFKFCLKLFTSYILCWLVIYWFMALEHATLLEVLEVWENPEVGSLVYGVSFALFAVLAFLSLFIRSYKQRR